MASPIDALFISIGLDGKAVASGMAEVESRLKSGVKNITSNILAPLAGAFAFKSLLSAFTETADALGLMAKDFRESVQDIQAWGDAVKSVGGNANALQSTVGALDKRIRDAGKGIGRADFRALGISATDANGKLKTSTDILRELSLVADKMQPDKFKALAKKLGVDDQTIKLLQSGSKEVDRLVSKYKDLAYTQKDADIAREFNRTMGDLNVTFRAAGAVIMRAVVPALSFMGDKTAVFVNFLRKHEPFVVGFFTTAAAVITGRFIPAIIKMGAAWLLNPMTWVLVGVMALVTALSFLIDDLWVYVQGGETSFGGLWATLGSGEEVLEMLTQAWEDMKAIGLAVWNALSPAANQFFDALKAAVPPFIEAFKSALKLLRALVEGDFGAAFEHLKDIFLNIGTFILNFFSTLFAPIINKIKEFVQGITNTVKSIVSKVPDFMLPDGLAEWANTIDETVKDVAPAAAEAVGPQSSAMAAEGVSPSATAGPMDNSVETNINGPITIQTQATDADGIAKEIGGALERTQVRTANNGGGH